MGVLKEVVKTNADAPRGKVSKKDVANVVKVTLLVAAAAALETLVEQLAGLDTGAYKPFIILGLTTVLDFVNKLVQKGEEDTKTGDERN